jgi:uncharacterized protein YjbJ (UPF0337 family)
MWNANERQGKVDQAKGKIKQAVGTLTGDDNLKSEGEVDEKVGKVEAAIGRTGKTISVGITKIADAVKK